MFAASKTDSVSGGPPDDKFNYVSMLLHGDGTNGAQNNTFLDSSASPLTITRNGNTTQGSFSPYGSNWSNFFDGTDDYLSVPSNAVFQFGTGDFAIECWFYDAGTSDTYPAIISSANGWQTGSTALRFNNTGLAAKFSFHHNPTGDPIFSSTNTFSSYQWYHVAVTRSGTSMKMFVNGVQEASATISASISLDTTTGVYIGSGFDTSSKIKGYVSNVRVVKGAAVYTSAFTPSTTPLTAISGTSLLTCQSNRFVDNSTTPFTITVNGNPSVQRFSPFGTSTAYSTSVIGGSSFFPTANTGSDNLSIANTSALSFTALDDMTIESWVYLIAHNTYSYICSKGNSSTREYGFTVRASSIEFYWSINGSADSSVTASFTFQVGTWYHVAMSKSGTSIRLFVNGTQQGSTGTFTSIYNGSSPFRAGTFMDFTGISHCLAGYLSNLRIVKGTAVYTSNFTPPTAPVSAITNTSLLINSTNGAIFDNAMINDLETVGNAQISTSVVKYGTGSMSFVRSPSSYLVANNTTGLLSLGTGDWTVEAWVYMNTLPSGSGYSDSYWIVGGGPASSNAGFDIAIGNTNLQVGLTSFASLNINTAHGMSQTTWYHVAVARSGVTLYAFINGVQLTSASVSGVTVDPCLTGLAISAAEPTGATLGNFNGYIDDLRITKGYARYTANFTPPSQAFSDTGPY